MERRPVEMMASATIVDIVRTISDRRKSFIATFLITTAALAALVIAWPNRYASDGLMFVRLGRGAVSIDPAAQSSKSVSLMESRQSEVVSVAHMLRSREIAERVVEKIGLDEINKPRTWVEKSASTLTSFIPNLPGSTNTAEDEAYDAQINHEEAANRVQEWVDVSVPRDTYTVSIVGEGTDPILVQQIVQQMMDEYQRLHVEAHRATGSLKFFEDQVASSQRTAIETQHQLQSTKAKMGWPSIASAEKSLAERINLLELKRDEASSALAEADAHAQALGRQLASVQQWVPTLVTKGIANKAAEDMRTALYAAQIENSEALSKLKPSHPRYKLVQKTLAEGQEIFDEEKLDREQSQEAINPVFQAMQTELEATIAKAAGLKSRYESLVTAVESANDDLVRLNTDGIELAQLKWASSVAEENFMIHSKSLEEARVSAALDNEELSDVTVIQPATLNMKKVGPPRLALLVLSMVLGLLVAALQAILRQTAIPKWAETYSLPQKNDFLQPQPVTIVAGKR